MNNFFYLWILAFLPIGAVLILMTKFNWGGGKAGAAGWLITLVIAWAAFGANPRLIAYSQMKGLLLSLNVLYIIWAALLLYNVVKETGAIAEIGNSIQEFSSDKVIQLLLFGWVFGSFLQGVAGYGIPIAVVAPLLVGMRFNTIVAVAVPAIAHSWSVTFGSMGASFQALVAVTGMELAQLAPWCAVYLGLATYLCGIASIHVYGGWRSVLHGLLAVFIVGTVMASTQYFLSTNGMWTMGGFGASLAGLAACILVARAPIYTRDNGSNIDKETKDKSRMGLWWALSAYFILILVVLLVQLYSPLHEFANKIKLTMHFPRIESDLGWIVEASDGKKISIFGHGGALLAYASFLSFCLYSLRGYYKNGAINTILQQTVKSGIPTTIGIVSMVGFALVMDQCGMTYQLAKGISLCFGAEFSFFAPWIGLLGAFMTGSNTNSNVVFGVLQQQTALLAGLNVAIILAAQTTGGALGSMIAPAKILVGCSTVGLSGKEAPVLKVTISYGLILTAIFGVFTGVLGLLTYISHMGKLNFRFIHLLPNILITYLYNNK